MPGISIGPLGKGFAEAVIEWSTSWFTWQTMMEIEWSILETQF